MSDSILLQYSLYDLPSAQHKAGLVGLLLCIESMEKRQVTPLPEVESLTATRADIRFTQESMQALFDDLYDAQWVEQSFDSKWRNKVPKRTEEIEAEENGNIKKITKYIYDVLQPKGAFLDTFYPPNAEVWGKLWRDMLWGTLRGVPKTRGVYEERANGNPSKIPAKLIKTLKKKQNTPEPLVSSLFIGAMDKNAEGVHFTGPCKLTFLLHFWLPASLIYAPRILENKHSKDKGMSVNQPYKGYVFAIPEPDDLEYYCESFKDILGDLNTDVSGFRPKQAIIDMPGEAGLEFIHHLARQKTDKSLSGIINAVEIFHLEKQGNNIRMLAAQRIEPSPQVLDRYESMRNTFFNPLYKTLRLGNLLHGRLWWETVEKDFNTWPVEFFIHSKKTPAWPSFYGRDVKKTFSDLYQELQQHTGGDHMSDEEKQKHIAVKIHSMIQNYVRRKAEKKTNKKYENFAMYKDEKGRESKSYPPDYREAVERISSQAFLAMRGRREKDFVEYFTGSICSVPQFLPPGDFQAVSRALLEDWEQVKTLSMLALSACSHLPAPKQNKEGDAS